MELNFFRDKEKLDEDKMTAYEIKREFIKEYPMFFA